MRFVSIFLVALISFLGCLEIVNDKENNDYLGFYTPKSISWTEQGWSQEERDYWHHLNAGQEFAPLSWLKALEAPDTTLSMLDPAYLRSLGFLDKEITQFNPEGLPVGFSIKPAENKGRVMLGLTCASCHTGQINFKGNALRIDGGSANFNIYQFFTDYGTALGKTLQDADAWKKFSTSVLKMEPGSEYDLRKEVEEVINTALWEAEAYSKLTTPSVEAGHGRMDPFNRIGNEVFGLGLKDQRNYHASNAPVGVPYMWDITRFDWVHYNASFNQPVARNILQVLGNGGKTFFLDDNGKIKQGSDKWASNFNIDRLVEMEEGYASLRAPEWPAELLGSIDMEKAKKGRLLFIENCAHCHAPRPIIGTNPSKPEWEIVTIPVSIIGTDSSEAVGFMRRKYNVSKLLGREVEPIDGATGLQMLTTEMANYAYNKMDWTPEQIKKANGDDRPNLVRSKAVYKARPLDGVWSTPPFLHNASVPNIYELLSPPSERSITFWVGTFEYDPEKLGYITVQGPKSFLFDTRKPGNSNTGHAFVDDSSIVGKIGRLLSHDERMELIEYLKVLPSMPPDPQKAVKRNWN
jgi:hypothetical protein